MLATFQALQKFLLPLPHLFPIFSSSSPESAPKTKQKALLETQKNTQNQQQIPIKIHPKTSMRKPTVKDPSPLNHRPHPPKKKKKKKTLAKQTHRRKRREQKIATETEKEGETETIEKKRLQTTMSFLSLSFFFFFFLTKFSHKINYSLRLQPYSIK